MESIVSQKEERILHFNKRGNVMYFSFPSFIYIPFYLFYYFLVLEGCTICYSCFSLIFWSYVLTIVSHMNFDSRLAICGNFVLSFE